MSSLWSSSITQARSSQGNLFQLLEQLPADDVKARPLNELKFRRGNCLFECQLLLAHGADRLPKCIWAALLYAYRSQNFVLVFGVYLHLNKSLAVAHYGTKVFVQPHDHVFFSRTGRDRREPK